MVLSQAVESPDVDFVFECRFPLSDFGLPARDDGLYLHSAPNARHLEHMGRALLHLTLARKQVSQEALNLGVWGFDEFAEYMVERVVVACLKYCWDFLGTSKVQGSTGETSHLEMIQEVPLQ